MALRSLFLSNCGFQAAKMGDSAYSYSLTTFSPSGKLLQIEHALNAVNKKGKLSLGIRAKDGVVLATSRKVPPLVDLEGFHKVNVISENVGAVYSGLGPDYRVLLKRARKVAQKYFMKYQDGIPTVSVCFMHCFFALTGLDSIDF